jgi:phosphatidylserine/phosphatidylglycerophosphate/cardiolipin synthase-like enzyme
VASLTGKPRERQTAHDVHYTRAFRQRFISSLSEQISHIVLCSPYFDSLPAPFGDVLGFCNFMQRRGTESIDIITRPPGTDLQALKLDTAKRLAAQGVRIFIRATPYLHAKMYHIEYAKGYYRTFVGSANFTIGGFDRNHEVVAEIEGVGIGSACHREIARMQELRSAQTFEAWIARGQPKSDEAVV